MGNLFDGTISSGEKWLKEFECPLEEMPVWVKKDAEIQVYPEPVSCTDELKLEKSIKIKFDAGFTGIHNKLKNSFM